LAEEIATLGLSESALLEYKLAKLEAAAESEIAAAAELDNAAALLEASNLLPEVAQEYRALAEARREAATAMTEQAALTSALAMRQTAVKAANESERAWENFARDIERSLTDSLYRAFENGENAGEALAKSLQNTFKAMVLKMVVQVTIQPVMDAVQQALGLSGGGSKGSLTGGSSQQGGIMDLFGGNNGSPNLGSYLQTAGGWMGNANLAAYGAGANLSSMQALEAANAYRAAGDFVVDGVSYSGANLGASLESGASGMFAQGQSSISMGGSTAGAALGYIGAIASLAQGNYSSGVGAAIGTAIMPGIGTMVGSTLGSLFGGGFGPGGAPKVNVNSYGTQTGNAVGMGQRSFEQANYPSYTSDHIKAIYSPDFLKSLAGVDRGYNSYAYLGGHLNVAGKSSNQIIAAALGQNNETLYNRSYDKGKGVEDFQKVISEETPRLQGALMLDALRDVSADYAAIVGGMVTHSTDLTSALQDLDANGVQSLVGGVQQTLALFKQFNELNIGSGADLSGEQFMALADTAGGADRLAQLSAQYMSTAYTEQEKFERGFVDLMTFLTDGFAGLGSAVPDSVGDFNAMIEALDLTTQGGQEAYVALMELYGGLNSMVSAIDQFEAVKQG